jgi:protein gp37
MAKKHGISWLNVPGFVPQTWNPIVGCSKISTGCEHCYAERMAIRLSNMAQPGTAAYRDVIEGGFDRPAHWNGKTSLVESALEKPLTWKKPRAIFVNSMGDLFHENTPDEWIASIWGIMAVCPQHLFIVLTKRAERMERWFKDENERCIERLGDGCGGLRTLPNVWIGVTAENQEQADKRIPHLFSIPAAKRFVSVEPMVEAVQIGMRGTCTMCVSFNCELHGSSELLEKCPATKKLDWVICGGESGPGARAMSPEWARGLRDQCQAAGVPFFFKQWGDWFKYPHRIPNKQAAIDAGFMSYEKHGGDVLDGRQWQDWPVSAVAEENGGH